MTELEQFRELLHVLRTSALRQGKTHVLDDSTEDLVWSASRLISVAAYAELEDLITTGAWKDAYDALVGGNE